MRRFTHCLHSFEIILFVAKPRAIVSVALAHLGDCVNQDDRTSGARLTVCRGDPAVFQVPLERFAPRVRRSFQVLKQVFNVSVALNASLFLGTFVVMRRTR